MRTADIVVAWLILLLGVIHCATTPFAFKQFGLPALWFFSGGLAVIFAAVLNMLRLRYGRVAPGIHPVCFACNLALLLFTVALGAALPLARNPQVIAAIVLLSLATLFSKVRRSRSYDSDQRYALRRDL